MSHHDEYRQWPFLTQEEFELACAFFDRQYVRANLGPTRRIFKIRSHRALTTGITCIEILRLLELPEDADELALALRKLGGVSETSQEVDMKMDVAAEDADQEALNINSASSGPNPSQGDELPPYALYSHQPYVTYEIHLHPTYNMPTLWFTLHDLPNGESPFDLDSVYRYLVPKEYKSQLRSMGVMGGISAAPHPVTDVPVFFIHPCQTNEAMENFDVPVRDYLIAWIGLVGGCVGLWVPPEMAVDDEK